MPQPYSTFLKDGATPEYVEDWSRLHPHLAIEIVRLLGAYSYIDLGYASVFAGFLHAQAFAASTIYNALLNRSNPEPVVDAVANQCLGQDQLDLYNACKANGKRWRDHRNAMAHGMWMYSPHTGAERVLLLAPRHWIQQGAQHQTIMLIKDTTYRPIVSKFRAPFDPEDLMVYSLTELAGMRAEIDRVTQAWFAFNAYLNGDAAPVKVERPLETLFAEKAIRDKVNEYRTKRGQGAITLEMAAAEPQQVQSTPYQATADPPPIPAPIAKDELGS